MPSQSVFGFHCIQVSDGLLIMATDQPSSHPFIQQIFTEHYCMSGAVLGTGDKAGHKTDQKPCPLGAGILVVQGILAADVAHRFPNPALPLTSCVTLGKWLHLSVPQHPHM